MQEPIKREVPDPSDPHCLTLLQAPPRRPQRKRIDAQGSHHTIPALVWGVHYIKCETITELSALLCRLEREPTLILIRGCPPIESARYLASLDQLSDSMREVSSSWSSAAPHSKRLTWLRRRLRDLTSDQRSDLEDERAVANSLLDEIDTLKRELDAVSAHLKSLGWLLRQKVVFAEVPRAWVWLDLDRGLELPPELKLESEPDHHAALRWVVSRGLPETFHDVSFVGQWSSSAFMRAREVKAHFTFLFDRPLDEGALKAWHGTQGACHWPLRWDQATFRTVQPHYTAAPQFIGIKSPLQQRTFEIHAPSSYVAIDRLSAIKLRAQGRAHHSSDQHPALASRDTKHPLKKASGVKWAPVESSPSQYRSGSGSGSGSESGSGSGSGSDQPLSERELQHRPVKKQCKSSLSIEHESRLNHQQSSLRPEVERAVTAQVSILSQAPEGERNQALYRGACQLGRYVGGETLSVGALCAALLTGAERCGLLDDVGEAECLRQIMNGVRWGVSKPISITPPTDTISLFDQGYSELLRTELRRAVEITLHEPRRMPVLALTCGGGKTTALCALMAEDAARGLTRIVLCRNHEMAREFLEGVMRYAERCGLDLSRSVRVLEGVQRNCQVLDEANIKQRLALEAALAYGRRALCGQGKQRCVHAGSCSGARRPKPLERGLTIATHAMGPLLKIPEGAVTLIDELPTPVRSRVVTSKQLSPLTDTTRQLHLPLAGTFEAWRARHPEVGRAGRAALRVLERLANAPNLAQQDYGQSLNAEECLILFEDVIPDLTPLIRRPPTPPPLPSAQGARRGVWPRFPERGLVTLLCDLARSLALGVWPDHVTLHWRQTSAWFEVRERYTLPPGSVVGLDGTAHRTEHLWSSLARGDTERILEAPPSSMIESRVAEIWPIAAVGEAPRFARWVKTSQLRTSQLIRRDVQGDVYWRARAVGSLKRVAFTIERAARDSQLHSKQPLGILAAKHVADLFRVATRAEVLPELNLKFKLDTPIISELVGVIRDALGHRELIIGHIGAHDIGSNLFYGVDLLAMLGSSKPDFGATLADLRALGISESEQREVYTHIVSARDVQALARARHLRRRGVGLLYIGDMSPPVGHDLPDVHWTRVEAAHLKPSHAQQELEERALALLIRQQWVSVPLLCRSFEISRAKANTICKRLQREHRLVEWRASEATRGRPSRIYGFMSAAPQAAQSDQGSLLELFDQFSLK